MVLLSATCDVMHIMVELRKQIEPTYNELELRYYCVDLALMIKGEEQ